VQTKSIKFIGMAIAMTIAITSPSIAQSPSPSSSPVLPIPNSTIKVGTRILPPFVVEDKGKLSGFSIELWNKIAEKIQVKSDFQAAKSIDDLLNLVDNRSVDVGVAAISVTADREKKFDFSQPIFDSGLQILVKAKGTSNPIGAFIGSLFSPSMLQLFGIMLLIVLIPAHIIWLLERNHAGGFLENSAYLPGIFKSLWWAAATLATQAEEMPKGAWGRMIALMWMFISVVFIAYFTATVTTSLTVEQLQTNIKGADDLPGKRVGTIASSTSEKYLKQVRIEPITFKQIEQAYSALDNGQIDAVVYDAPILLYYAAREGKGKSQVVGNIFRKESYGIAVTPNSPLRKQINKALLTIQEQGTYQQIYDKWFK
jgi:polar amino acid transport system substrate-binding protein